MKFHQIKGRPETGTISVGGKEFKIKGGDKEGYIEGVEPNRHNRMELEKFGFLPEDHPIIVNQMVGEAAEAALRDMQRQGATRVVGAKPDLGAVQ